MPNRVNEIPLYLADAALPPRKLMANKTAGEIYDALLFSFCYTPAVCRKYIFFLSVLYMKPCAQGPSSWPFVFIQIIKQNALHILGGFTLSDIRTL